MLGSPIIIPEVDSFRITYTPFGGNWMWGKFGIEQLKNQQNMKTDCMFLGKTGCDNYPKKCSECAHNKAAPITKVSHYIKPIPTNMKQDFELYVSGVVSDEDMIKRVIEKNPTMKEMEITVSGTKYWVEKVVPVAPELTLEDCYGSWVTNSEGGATNFPIPYKPRPDGYPSAAIAEKVLLYGLLCSVAHKLNTTIRTADRPSLICYNQIARELRATRFSGTYTLSPIFNSEDLANQAISIFAKSKFDLKKLYQ